LSTGERKRLSIAAAILLKPVLVFADEPTSGIDSFASLRVVEVLKGLAGGGRAVVVTLHQPRDAVWRLFDKLYLLSEGRLLYSGPPSGAVSWFSSLGYQAPSSVSVADWLLDLVAIGFDKTELGWPCLESTSDVVDASAKFSRGELATQIKEEIAASLRAARKEERAGRLWPQRHSPPDTAPVWAQTRALLVRHVLNYSRNLGNVVARLLLSLVAGLLVGVCYSDLRWQEDDDSRNLRNRMGSLFFCCLILMMSPNASMGLFVADRRFYSSEAAAHLYGSFSYYGPLALCELLVNLTAAGLFWTPVCLLSGAGQRHARGYLQGLVVCGLTQLCGAQVVNFCAMLLPNQELAFVASVAANVASFITAGFLIKTRNLPWYCAWIRFASPVKFGFHALVLNEFVDQRFDLLRQVDQLSAAVCEVGKSGCLRPGVVEPPLAVAWWLRRPEFQSATRAVLGGILESIDPCLFDTVRDGRQALACLQLDEPSAHSMLPSLMTLLLHLITLHLLGWLCLRHLHKERR
jgi:ATP-binding cassette subfamily G (WHITE) protein 2